MKKIFAGLCILLFGIYKASAVSVVRAHISACNTNTTSILTTLANTANCPGQSGNTYTVTSTYKTSCGGDTLCVAACYSSSSLPGCTGQYQYNGPTDMSCNTPPVCSCSANYYLSGGSCIACSTCAGSGATCTSSGGTATSCSCSCTTNTCDSSKGTCSMQGSGSCP